MYEFQKVFGIKYGMDKPNISESLFEKENITGRNGSIVSGFGVSFTWDSRNEAFSPNKGSFAQLKYIDFNKLFGSEYSYWNIVFDARRYIAVNTKHVLALQAFAFFNEGTVPIRSMALLGGNNNMRGYYDGRFRDKNQVVFQAEYRLPLFWRFGATGFGGLGEVSDRIGTLNTLHYTYGAGLRFALKPKEKLNIRVDYGFGEGGSNGLYFMIGEAF
ncbi:BamA/TamA family outer membrane protein [Pseudarcicella hirudinis]